MFCPRPVKIPALIFEILCGLHWLLYAQVSDGALEKAVNVSRMLPADSPGLEAAWPLTIDITWA